MKLNKKGNAVHIILLIFVGLFVALLAYGKIMPVATPFIDSFAASGADPWDIFLMSIIPFLALIAIIFMVVLRK